MPIPSDAVTDTTASLASLSMCTTYREELVSRVQDDLLDPCPLCGVPVGRHAREPVMVTTPSPGAGSAASVPVSSSAKQLLSPLALAFMKLKTELPKWSKTTTCRVFIQQLTRVLEDSGIPPENWYAVFSYVMEDENAAMWVRDHIIKLSTKPDWDTACKLFTTHFQTSDYSSVLRKQYRECKQGKQETVQQYADRFSAICAQLGLGDDDFSALEIFLSGLTEHIQHRYYNYVADREVGDHEPFVVTSLSKAATMCIKFDVAHRTTASLHVSGSTTSSNSNKPANAGESREKTSMNSGKWCTLHQTHTHNTSECHANKKQLGQGGSSNVKVEHRGDKNQTRPTIAKCYACGEPGHISPNCPRKSGAGSGGAVSKSSGSEPASSNSKSVHWSPSASDSATGSALRKSERPTNPPERFSPSANNITVVGDTVEPSTAGTAEQPAVIWLQLQNRVFKTLLDTGAESISFIDEALVKEFNLPITSTPGVIKLAHSDHDAKRIGKTAPLPLTAIFPVPELKLSSIAFTSSFEVMPLDSKSFQFILGRDVLAVLFPTSIPFAFYRPVSPMASQITHSVTSSPGCHHATVIDALMDDVVTKRVDPSSLMNELSGVGTLPLEESPERWAVSTSRSKEQEYQAHRQTLLDDPSIQSALAANEAITGFCTLPESVVKLSVDPEKERSLYRKQYNVPKAAEAAVDEIVNRWFETGRIVRAPVNCPYNSPLCVALKKDAFGHFTGFRVCLDVRQLNSSLTVCDRFQLPYIRNVLERFIECVIFGEFDLSEAYLQFMLHPDSQPYTAFTWRGIQYMFVGCPFGISLLPSLFQRVMSSLFHDLGFTVPYLDNLPFGSTGWKDHREHALLIIERLNEANLKIKPSSVKIGHSEIRCLGHLLSGEGISLSPTKIEQIEGWPLPNTGKELQSFLGLATFVRHHVRHFADITAPLEAVKNDTVIEWTESLREHFELTKKAIATAPILQFADFRKPFHIATDASNTGVGGVLYQPDESGEITPFNIVSICSKKLQASHLNYPAYKKELWGIVYCLRQFHTYVWGRTDLVIHTDHKPLTYMFESNELSNALQQWLDVILDYRFEIRYRPGILNVLPDALSRMYSSMYDGTTWGVSGLPFKVVGAPVQQDPTATNTVEVQCHAGTVVTRSKSARLRSAPIQDLVDNADSKSDSEDELSLQGVVTGSEQDHSHVDADEQDDHLSRDDQTAVTQSDSTLVSGGGGVASASTSSVDLMIELAKRGKKAPASTEEKAELIQKEHLFGHFGREAIFKALYNKGYWWPKMRDEIENAIASCDPCNRYTVVKSGFNPSQFITSSGPWDHIQLDTSVHLPVSPGGYTALLVIIDVFTGFVFLRPLKTNSAEIVARKLWKVCCIVGIPKIIQSDNGSEFCNDVIRALVKLTGMDHRLIAPYNPRADGKVERAIGTVASVIKKHLHGTEKHWPLYVPFAQLSFNNKVSSLTSSSPFVLMFGRELNELKDYTDEQKQPTISLEDWKDHQHKIMSLIYPAINDRTIASKSKMAKMLDAHRRQLLPQSIPAGSTVMLKDPKRVNKWEAKYIGPFIVVRRNHAGNFVLRDETGDQLDRSVPPDQLKLIAKKNTTKDDVYEVERILQHRGAPGSYQYLVRWKTPYTEADDSWEPSSSFRDPGIMKRYWKSKEQSSK